MGSRSASYCDNGSEFVSAAMDLWTYTNGVILDFSRRGKPTDNAAIRVLQRELPRGVSEHPLVRVRRRRAGRRSTRFVRSPLRRLDGL